MSRWRRRIGAALAIALVAGCGTATDSDTLASQVTRIADDSGNEVITRFSFGTDPADLLVFMRTPQGERVFDSDGAREKPPRPMPVGASRPDAFDFEGLEALLAEVGSDCAAEPSVSVVVAPSGVVVADAMCGDELVKSTFDGEELGPPAIDPLSAEGIAQVLAEANAMLPQHSSYLFSVPGPATGRGDISRFEGMLWALPDGRECWTVLRRRSAPSDSGPLRTLRCDGFGQQQVDEFDDQEPFLLSGVNATEFHDAFEPALRASGFDESDVALYLYHDLFIDGPQLWVVDRDEAVYVHALPDND